MESHMRADYFRVLSLALFVPAAQAQAVTPLQIQVLAPGLTAAGLRIWP